MKNVFKIKNYIINSKVFKKSIITVIGIILISVIFILLCNQNYGYQINFNGKEIAVVKNLDDFHIAITRVENDLANKHLNKNIEFDKNISYEKIRIRNDDDIKDANQCINAIYQSGLNIRINGVAIVIEGNEIVYLSSIEEAESVVEKVIEYYTALGENERLVSYEIKQEYQLLEKQVELSQLRGISQAVRYLLQGTDEIKEYTVKKGDTTWNIATSRGISVSDMQEANPDKNLKVIHNGDTLKLTVEKPYISVLVIKEVIYDEKIPYGTSYVKDSSVYIGDTKIKEPGKYGIKEVAAKISFENGIEVTREVLNENIVKNPTDRIIAKGTKALPPVIGTGQFIIPASGRVTAINKPGSHAGGRAVDIANGSAPSIYASDTGVVKTVKYEGGYGRYIIIDHGGGYSTLYAHLSSTSVSIGQKVNKGDKIGRMGSTGNSTGTHLHFEIRYNDLRQKITNFFSYLRIGRYVKALS